MSAARSGLKSNRLGVKHTPETRAKISAATRERTPKGEACHSYKDGKHAERMGERFTAEYKRWRFDVYSRDAFTCQHCGDATGGNLHAHHIASFADHVDLRTTVANGITLCDTCHRSLHSGAWTLETSAA